MKSHSSITRFVRMSPKRTRSLRTTVFRSLRICCRSTPLAVRRSTKSTSRESCFERSCARSTLSSTVSGEENATATSISLEAFARPEANEPKSNAHRPRLSDSSIVTSFVTTSRCSTMPLFYMFHGSGTFSSLSGVFTSALSVSTSTSSTASAGTFSA